MSKVAIKGASTGTATFTIESPATNTDRTLVLPDAAGTVALTSQIPAAPTIASTAEAQAGTNNTNFITPLRMREGFNASGSAPVYACRAWVNFNGTTSPGTIRASGNVSSVTRNGTGDYTVNFTTAMPDANYSAVANSDTNPGFAPQAPQMFVSVLSNSTVAPTTSGFRLSTRRMSDGLGVDETYVTVSVFR
jgi:hypothetical protein